MWEGCLNCAVRYENINYGNEEDFKNAVRFVQYLNLEATEYIFQTKYFRTELYFFVLDKNTRDYKGLYYKEL